MNEPPYPVAVYKFLQSVVEQTVDWKLEESMTLKGICEEEGLIRLVEITEKYPIETGPWKNYYQELPISAMGVS